MKTLSFQITIIAALTLQLVYAGKPNKVLYFPNDTKTVSGITFIKVGVGTKKDMKNNTFSTYYLSTSKITWGQFSDFLNDIKAEVEIAGIYKNDTCLISDMGFLSSRPMDGNYNHIKKRWIFSVPIRSRNSSLDRVSTFGATYFCRWFQEKTGEYVRLPRPDEYYPILPQNIKRYVKKHKKLLSKEDIKTIHSLNVENVDFGTEWAQHKYGLFYIMNYEKNPPKGMWALYLTGVALPIVYCITPFIKVRTFKASPVYSSANNVKHPTIDAGLGFRLVIP